MQEQPVSSAPIFKVIKWNVVGSSGMGDASQTMCAICKNEITVLCIHCQSMNDPSKSCMVVEGACRHTFHHHCLDTWHKNSKTYQCVICKMAWSNNKTKDINSAA